MKSAIVVGSTTTHGGVVKDGEPRWLVDGKAAHLGGMTHYCPQCKTVSTAIPDPNSLNVYGKLLILAGDKTSCGAEFLPTQNLLVVDRTSAQYSSTVDSKNSSFLSSVPYFDEQFVLQTSEGDILANTPYTIKMNDGSFKKGVSDENGKTERIQTQISEKLEIYIGEIHE